MTYPITSEMLQRVVNIKVDNQSVTAFFVYYKNKPYLITAKHAFINIPDKTTLNIEIRCSKSTWKIVQVTIHMPLSKDIDLVVLSLANMSEEQNKDDSKILNTSNLILGQDVFFLGFPYNFALEVDCSINNNLPLPLVKKATISSLPNMTKEGLILLDGNNNPGFSGAPVCFFNEKLKRYQIAGVISGYYCDKIEMSNILGGNFSLAINSGIIIVYDIKYAFEILEYIETLSR